MFWAPSWVGWRECPINVWVPIIIVDDYNDFNPQLATWDYMRPSLATVNTTRKFSLATMFKISYNEYNVFFFDDGHSYNFCLDFCMS